MFAACQQIASPMRGLVKPTMVVKIVILPMISFFGVIRTFDASLAPTCYWMAQETIFGKWRRRPNKHSARKRENAVSAYYSVKINFRSKY